MKNNRIFIEDIGSLLSTIKGTVGISTKVWKVEDIGDEHKLPDKIYLVESGPGEKFLLGRKKNGREKFEIIQDIARILLNVGVRMETKMMVEPRQFIILRGAYPFDLQDYGRQLVFNNLLPTTWTKLQRVLKDGEWKIEQDFLYPDRWEGKTWLVPETAIASGSTITYLLKKGFKKHKPETVVILTACGSLKGVKKAYEVCKKYEVEMICFFSQAIFEVSKEGNLPGLPLTDLPIENPETITGKEFYKKAHQLFQGIPLCSVGDVGDSLWKVAQYIVDTFWEIQIVGLNPTKESWEWTRRMWEDQGFRAVLREEKPKVHQYFQGYFSKERR